MLTTPGRGSEHGSGEESAPGWDGERAPEAVGTPILLGPRLRLGLRARAWRLADGHSQDANGAAPRGPRRGPGEGAGHGLRCGRRVRAQTQAGAVRGGETGGPEDYSGLIRRRSGAGGGLRDSGRPPPSRCREQHPRPLLPAPARVCSVRAPQPGVPGEERGEGRSLYLALTRRVPGPRLRFPL